MLQVLIICFGFTLIPSCITTRLTFFVRLLVVQGLLIFGIAVLNIALEDWEHFLMLLLEVLIIKAIVVPWFLYRTILRNRVRRDIEAYLPNLLSLLIGALLLIGGFLFAEWVHEKAPYIQPLQFGLAFSTIGVGFFIMTSRKKLITSLMGYMVMENGIFLLSLSVVLELPFLVNLGVLMDLFMMVLLGGLFINRIHSTFGTEQVNIEHLTSLKH